MFHWLGIEKRHARASNRVLALKCKVHVPALLMLPHRYDDSAIRFESAAGTTVDCQREWLQHLSCDWWTVLDVRIAEEPCLAMMRYLDKDLLPLCYHPTPSLRRKQGAPSRCRVVILPKWPTFLTRPLSTHCPGCTMRALLSALDASTEPLGRYQTRPLPSGLTHWAL